MPRQADPHIVVLGAHQALVEQARGFITGAAGDDACAADDIFRQYQVAQQVFGRNLRRGHFAEDGVRLVAFEEVVGRMGKADVRMLLEQIDVAR